MSSKWTDYSPLLQKAYDFAKRAHGNQRRASGGLYFNHVEKTAEMVAEWGLDEPTIAAALLHDVVEDTPITLEELEKEFGEEIAFLVSGVTKLGRVKHRGEAGEAENMRKFILAVSKDIRVILIKLADRLHNMQTLGALPPQKQKRIAEETLEIYSPLAYRLGMFHLAGELDDLAFPYVYPKEYRWIKEKLKERYSERKAYADRVKPAFRSELEKHGVSLIKIDSRAKRYSSLYRKLLKYDMDINRVYDLVAIRCIVATIEDCYGALGAIHGRWLPMPKRIKDYIALPKPNGYRSLHTTIFGPENKILEVQIRTPQMHEEAEYGIAWAYHHAKESKQYLQGKTIFAKQDELAWVKQLKTWQKKMTDPREFMTAFKIDFLENRILTLTPRGKVVELPKNATPVDFAYQIHSEVGDSCVGARVNGNITPLNAELKSGDVVEILRQKNKKPSPDWLNFVKTSQARNRIKTSLRRSHKSRLEVSQAEFKIMIEDRVGLLKDICDVISRSHVNITDHMTFPFTPKDKFRRIKICCALTDPKKTEKIVEKIKKVKGVRSVEHRLM